MDLRSLIHGGRQDLARAETPYGGLRREMDRLFDDFSRGFGTPALSGGNGLLSPKVDVAETEKGLELTAELPGVDQDDIELSLHDGVLTLKAEHQEEKEEKDEKKQYHLVERARGTYMRRFALPFEADDDKVEARFDKGVLHVFVPRSETAEKAARKIKVKGK